MPRSMDRIYQEQYEAQREADEERASECDCCGKLKYGCVDLTYMGMDTHACPQCRFEDDDGERVQ